MLYKHLKTHCATSCQPSSLLSKIKVHVYGLLYISIKIISELFNAGDGNGPPNHEHFKQKGFTNKALPVHRLHSVLWQIDTSATVKTHICKKKEKEKRLFIYFYFFLSKLPAEFNELQSLLWRDYRLLLNLFYYWFRFSLRISFLL